ncbi:MAG: hypothetical protein EOM23_07460, partial [Candidatus Moranbacteria bacterium]|nr:hypothetical protein [Candidatus Moranbacteria bacterium]
DALRKTFIDVIDALIYLKDEKLNYIFVNRATERFYDKTADEMIGKDDYMLSEAEFAQTRRQSDIAVLKKMSLVTGEAEWDGRIYKTAKFPVELPDGQFGVGAYITDITEEREHERKQEKALLSDLRIRKAMELAMEKEQVLAQVQELVLI